MLGNIDFVKIAFFGVNSLTCRFVQSSHVFTSLFCFGQFMPEFHEQKCLKCLIRGKGPAIRNLTRIRAIWIVGKAYCTVNGFLDRLLYNHI